MKKIIFALLVAVILYLPSSFCFSNTSNINHIKSCSVFNISDPEIDYIEYVCIDGQWYKIIHYTDGTIGVVPVNAPPFD